MRASCQLYQLLSGVQLPIGAYVAVNGPWDRYGYVIKSSQDEGGHLNLIRGCEARPDEKPLAQF